MPRDPMHVVQRTVSRRALFVTTCVIVAMASHMKHVLAHDLTPEVARRVAKEAFAAYRVRYAKYRPTMTWVDEDRAELSFTAKGITLRGSCELIPGAVVCDLRVPVIFRPFKAKAVEIVERELAHWSERVARGEVA